MGIQCPLYYSSFPPAFPSWTEKAFPNRCRKQSFSAKPFGFEKGDFFWPQKIYQKSGPARPVQIVKISALHVTESVALDAQLCGVHDEPLLQALGSKIKLRRNSEVFKPVLETSLDCTKSLQELFGKSFDPSSFTTQ